MKIYTKKGDKGTTTLIGGTKLPKNHLRIEAYGTVDELNSWMGLCRDIIDIESIKNDIIFIQDRLFTIGSLLASDGKNKMKLPEIKDDDIVFLENRIDDMNEQIPPMKSFVLPGGNPIVSQIHITRCVCRRAERLCVALHHNEVVEDIILKYLNRLSDYLFVLARFMSHHLKVKETPWKPSF
ncbi:MAG: cob(I)yrinic acid a,c-diamide adenosyltransferase [Bacteroidetes bacterium]|nr:MAG: cob(I)yrinic acid a,c-diamide adenosyltransferase [Bacteroidota bacterium]